LAVDIDDEFDRILSVGEPVEVKDTKAKENLEKKKKEGPSSLLKPKIGAEEEEKIETLREEDPEAAEKLEAEFLADGDEDFDDLVDEEESGDESEEEEEGMSPEERRELIVAISAAAATSGQKLPRKWEKKTDEELLILSDLMKAKRKSHVVREMTKKTYFTCTSLIETFGPKLTVIGERGLQVQGLTTLLESDSLVDQALGLVAEELETSMKDYINPYTMLALATGSAVCRLHASNSAMILAAETAPPELIERMNGIRRPKAPKPGKEEEPEAAASSFFSL